MAEILILQVWAISKEI